MKPYILGVSTCALFFASTTAVIAQTTLEEFLFNDANGTALNATTNTGTQGSNWRFGGWTTDGSGNLAFDSGQGTATRKLPERGTATADPSNDFYIPALQHSTGVYRFEIEFDVNLQANSAGDNISWGINDAAGARMVRLSIRESGGDVQVQFSAALDDANDAGNNQFRTQTIGANTQAYTGITAAIEFDFDNNTVDYFYNGSSILGSALSFNVDGNLEVGQLLGSSGGTWGTGGTNAFNLDTLRFSAVPEASSYALLAGMLALGSVMVRRRR